MSRMEDAPFSISLQDYPSLFVVPLESYPTPVSPELADQLWADYLEEQQQLELARTGEMNLWKGIEALDRDTSNFVRWIEDPVALKSLCQRFLESDERKAVLFADRALQRERYDTSVVVMVCRLTPEMDTGEIVRCLLSTAERYSELYALRSACMMAAAGLCAQHGLSAAARAISLAVISTKGYLRAARSLGDSHNSHEIAHHIHGARAFYFNPSTGNEDEFWFPNAEHARHFNALSAGQELFLGRLLEVYGLEAEAPRLLATAQNAIIFAP
ncbi:hypothetical protein EON80_06655, partial [bacterium]